MIYKARDGSMIGGSAKDINEAIQADHAAELRAKKEAGIKLRAKLARGQDPFTKIVMKGGGKTHSQWMDEEDNERAKLHHMITARFMSEIGKVLRERQQISQKSKELLEDYSPEELEADYEKLHERIVSVLEKIVQDLMLPYEDEIEKIKKYKESWKDKHTRIIHCFSRRLRRAIPYCLKIDINRDFFWEPEVKPFQFAEDVSFCCKPDLDQWERVFGPPPF